MFRVEVRVAGEIAGVGTGKTKKEAEQLAAVAALTQLGAEGI
jgi:dsRNA-specific ribonuclease